MASRGFFPSTDTGVELFTKQFSQQLSAAPEAFGIDRASAEAYAGLVQVFAERRKVANSASTRTVITVRMKNDSRRELRRATSALARRVYAFPEITNEQLCSLGLTIRKRATEVAAPTAQPRMTVKEARGRTVTLVLNDRSCSGRARPDGTLGIMLFRCLGISPARRDEDWQLDQLSSQRVLKATFDQSIPNGTPVWFRAQFIGKRLTRGPMSDPVVAVLQGCFDSAAIERMAA